ncbi:MAG TPA: class I SAM-dependent methyltransferase [Capillimicrobium sp.]|nr:class I SAM-dependent methyltransferase [Capillimicrobium sp.]
MSEVTGGPRALLKRPAAYVSLQRLLGADASHRRFADEHIRAAAGDRVLDLGCGPGDALRVLPDVDYLGVDLSAEYIESARRRYGERGRFRVADVCADDLAGEGPFAVILAMGLLHHLDDDGVRRVLSEAAGLLGPDGRFVSIDPARAPGQHAIARWLVSLDRGRHVRSADELGRLAHEAMPDLRVTVRHDLLRVPYTHVVLETVR